MRIWWFTPSSRSMGRANKKAASPTKMGKAAKPGSPKRVKGGLRPFSSVPCRVQGQRPCWGLGQRPNCSAGDQYAQRAQQRCRQRSVPASNFARPQTRPQAALLTNSTLSRQMGATDQHGRRFSLNAGLFHCRGKTESVSYRNRKAPAAAGQSSLCAAGVVMQLENVLRLLEL